MKHLNIDPAQWRKRFAWLPVKTLDGFTACLEQVERRWNPEINFRIIDARDPGYCDGGWEYRTVAKT
jgi:hypothetical protein